VEKATVDQKEIKVEKKNLLSLQKMQLQIM
jgi:hypothetical protein